MKPAIIIAILSFYTVFAHAQVFYKGEIVPARAKYSIEKIRIMKPIGMFPQSWYAETSDDLLPNEQGQMQKLCKLPTPNLNFLTLSNGQLFVIIAEPGDTIHFQLAASDSNRNLRLRFFGKDSFCNDYVNHLNQTILNGIQQVRQ